MEFSANILKNIAFAPNKKYFGKAFFARLSLFSFKSNAHLSKLTINSQSSAIVTHLTDVS